MAFSCLGFMTKIKQEHKIVISTSIAVIIIWCVDAAYESFVSREGSFLHVLATVTGHGAFLRMVLTFSVLVFGVSIAHILSKQNHAEAVRNKKTTAIERSTDGIAIFDHEGNYIYANQSYATMNGYENPAEMMGKTLRQAYDEKELESLERICNTTRLENGQWRGELTAKRKNGSTYNQEASVSLLEDGSRVYIIRDITRRKRNEERLRQSERFLNMIFNSIRDPFCIIDNEFRIIRANAAYATLKRKTVDDLIGRKCHAVLENSDTVCEGCVVDKSFNSLDPCVKEKNIETADGSVSWVEIYTYPILEEDGTVSHIIEYTRDITERKRSEEEKHQLIVTLEHLSRTDGLTGLMNRRALTEILTYEADRARRFVSPLSLILCDIDGFKNINDTYGHNVGDRVLQSISATLKTLLRKTDTVGRYGGDEFMLILPETARKGANNLAGKLLAAMQDTDLNLPDGKPLRLSVSIGIAEPLENEEGIDALIKRADDAMYASKQRGKNRITFDKR